MNFPALLAATLQNPVDVLKAEADRARSNPIVKDMAVVVGIGLLLVVIGMIWAVYFRKGRRHRHRDKPRTQPSKPAAGSSSKAAGSHRRRRRVRIENHRPRNPTLADTIGLPPLKPEPEPEFPPAEKPKPS